MKDLHADGFHSKDWRKEFRPDYEDIMMDDTHCFDCEHRLDDCTCFSMEEGDAWLVTNFGEDGLH